MDEEVFKSKLKGLLDEYGSSIHQDGAFCTTYFITSEFFDGDGQYWASTFYDTNSPMWRVTGLVQHALENDFLSDEGDEE
jgi:hypothetical protein